MADKGSDKDDKDDKKAPPPAPPQAKPNPPPQPPIADNPDAPPKAIVQPVINTANDAALNAPNIEADPVGPINTKITGLRDAISFYEGGDPVIEGRLVNIKAALGDFIRAVQIHGEDLPREVQSAINGIMTRL